MTNGGLGGGPIAATTSVAATTVTALTLPNTGSNIYVTAALSIAAGLVTWGVLYLRAR
jgi:LPXTG-motif cell wall-anchored protein